MEAMNKKLIFALLVVAMMAFSGIQKAAAAEAPAPSPTSDATQFMPAIFASLVALAFGFMY
ncbi:Arabinogalactan peptide [Parasponia andersonii]|uniref:Arabinogalactan peptide n=1 Tax=Parasponia andersonii TaxID=3476 RepID=A0A2P5CT07_PARAD|nr:Arabinogalactan peptide [Parasponia andersonii]